MRAPTGPLYVDPRLDAAFGHGWQLLDPYELPEEGVAVPFELLGEPLVATRRDGRLRVLSNVCTHRAAILLEGPDERIRCPYHGRSFGLDGACIAAPGFSRRDPDMALPELPVRGIGPLLFTRLGAGPELAEAAAPFLERWPYADDAEWEVRPAFDYTLDAPWGLYVENYLEGLHLPFVHPTLTQAVQVQAYETRAHDWCVLQESPAAGQEAFTQGPAQGLAALWLWLWPNTMLNCYPWGVSVNTVLPQGRERCRIRYQLYVCDPDKLGTGAGGALDQVEREDHQVVLRVARGLRSQLYRGGALSPRWEQGVARFHALMRATVLGE